ncbi:MAG: right-handed parallel beta-helix repeat-containing protein, partial [Anaerolinea sp.]|nr:right-handed parallel beta-helix repeat-containing protein [Anaerolinea sp.]
IRNESIGAGGLPGLWVQNSSIHDNSAQGGGGISNGLGGILRITNTIIHANGAQWGGGISNDGTNTALTIINSTISSNTATGNLGGGLSNYANASFTISGSFFDGNSTDTQGAAIYNENGSATISTTEFTNNTATYDGAAYYGNHATGTITSSTMDGNHGEDGAAILLYDNSSLTLDDVEITNNVATGWGGGVFALATSSVTIQNGTLIDGNTAAAGGGIALGTTGTGTVTNSTISYNQANNGGGVYSQGALTVTSSTVDHNTASVGGGGIFHASASGTTITGSTLSNNSATNNGGALTNNGAGLVTITGSTITGNTSTFGAGVNVFDARTIEISGSTFSDNHATTGGGFSSSGTVMLTNVVFSGNTASSVGGGFSTGPNATTNLTATDIFANEANNGAGIHNRGDLTIDGGSISDNAGTGNGGAIYNWDAGVVSVNGTTIAGNGAYGSGGAIFNSGSGSSITLDGVSLTLNAADTNANAFGAGGAIYNESGGAIIAQAGTVIGGAVGSGNYAVIGGGIYSTGTGSTLLIDDSMVTYNTAGNSGGLENLSGSAATITNSSVDHNTSNAFSGGYGGGVGGTLNASDSSFSYNTAASAGGGIMISSTASATLTNVMVIGNASAQGGGVWMDGTATISGSTIDGNTSTTIAGGLFVGALGHQTLVSSTISNNTATTTGGGIVVDGGGTLDMSATTVSTNAATDGGGIWNAGTLTLDQVVIQSNEVTHYGGGLYHTGGALTSQNGTQFIGNTSVLHGGGIYNNSTGTAANISGTTFTANIANVSGGNNADGGAYYGAGSTATITASTMTDNQAEDGGAVLLFNNASLTLDNVDLVHNLASQNGGGILALSGAALHIQNGSLVDLNEAYIGAGLVVWAPATATVDASTISRNKATFVGGGISSAGAVTITNSLIDNNDGGSTCGGGIIHYGTSQTLTLTNTIISNNTAVNNGGGICQQAASGLVLINGGSQITGNDADIGAGINAYDNTHVVIEDSTISGNTAHITGGGIGTGGTLTVTNSSIVNNQSVDRSAGLRIAALGNVTLNSSHVDNNHADGSFAGGIGTVGTLTVNGGTINNNQAKTDGGGIYTLGGSVTLNGVALEGNHADSDSNASGNGGGLYISSGTLVNLSTGTVIGGAAAGQGNTAFNGGGIWNAGTLNSNQVLYRYNMASGNGGGLFLETGASGAVANSVFTNNTAAAGGGVYSDSGSAALINSTVYGNSSGLQFADSSAIRNVIAYGNTGGDCAGTAGAQFSLIGTGTCATNGVNGSAVGFDPLFVDAVGGNFALNATSPAIDGGNSTFAAAYANDYVGAARVQGASVDMGAVESAFETTVSLTATDDVAAEAGGDDGTFQLTRTGNTSGELIVTLDVGGTVDSADYDLTQGATSLTGTPISVTFPANTTTLDLTLTALQDLLLEGSETVVLTLQDGANYNLTAQVTATVTIVDDDTFGIVVSQSLGSTDLTEAGASDSFTITLTSIPAQPVTITLTHDPADFVAVGDPDGSIELVLDAQALTGIVEFEAINDALVEGLEIGSITFTVASADANYNGLVIAPLPVNITDNDDAAVSFDSSAGNAPEAVSPYGVNAVLTITSDPVGGSLAEPLDVAIVEAAGSAFTPDDYTLVTIVASFPAGALDQAVTPVSVAIANDSLAEGSETFTLSFGAVTGAGTASGSHAVTIIDDEGVGVDITPTGGLITTEAGGTATFDVVLTSQPTANVTVSFTSGDTSEGTVTPAITFTPANWSSAQTVTITGVDDLVDDGDIAYVIAVTVTSGDPGYNNLAVADVSVTNTDDDTAGVNVSPTSGLVTTEAGGTANFSVVLTSQPTANVTISLTSSHTTEGTVPAAITFTPANWSSAQTITVTGVDDLVDDGDIAYTIQTTVTSSDVQYNGIAAADVSVVNTDDDTAGVTVNPTSGLVTTEAGGTATFSVVLTSRPTENVSVNLLSGDTSEGTVPTAITFTPANWNSAQNVTVTGVDDAVVDGSIGYTIVTTVSSLDSVYNGIAAADVSVTNMDNDTAGVVVNPTSGLVTTEAGSTATFSVILTSQPAADVTVNLLSSDLSEGTAPAAITFTPANWNAAQTVTVTGVDDALADGNIGYTIQTTVTSGDAIYNGIGAADVGVTNMDDETANVLVSPTSGLITTEAGGTATFSVVLSSQPLSDVTINLTSSDPTEGAVPTAITFIPADWNSAQIVTVTGVDDLIDDGDIAYSILTTVTSGDATYNGIAAADVNVTNTDDDTAGVTVNPTVGLITTEAGGTAAFTVVLTSQPTADVTVNLTSSDLSEGAVPTAITFTPANWNSAQAVTVTGVNDLIDDGDIGYSIVTTVSSADGAYNGITAADVSVTNTDDDTAGVTVSPTSGLVTTEA